jgi:amino acid transporter
MSNLSDEQTLAADAATLHKMGYAQELSRRMGGFSNFAISFSIICILAGGITAFQVGFSTGGGFGVFVGWIVGSAYAMIVALAMAQIASAYPTAGGLYHWSSILGGRGWGWATAFVNLLGLIFVVSSVDVGVYFLFNNLILGNIFGVNTASWGGSFPSWAGGWQQVLAVALITASQAAFNHRGIKVTTLLTDFSGYLIFVVAVVLTITMLYGAPHLDFSRLVTFTNNSGAPGGGVVPQSGNALYVFLLGLLLPIYTITGFDASAHTAEETKDARRAVPKGMINAVFWSFAFGLVMVASFVLAMPDPGKAALDGANVFFNLFASLAVPAPLKDLLYICIVLANYLCALAGVTSVSRMIFAFSRDGGLPGHKLWRHVNPVHRTPVPAIWLGAGLAFLSTLYSSAFSALAAGCAMFLYVSYAMPILAGLLSEGKSWTEFGPFRLGVFSKPVAVLALLGTLVVIFIGIQPPNNILISYGLGLIALMLVLWFGVARKRFPGPPIGDQAIAARGAEIAAEERAVGQS